MTKYRSLHFFKKSDLALFPFESLCRPILKRERKKELSKRALFSGFKRNLHIDIFFEAKGSFLHIKSSKSSASSV